MGIVNKKTTFTNLFGDPDYPIYGDNVVVETTPTPTPSVTPSPSVTPQPTPTPTPSSTPSFNPSQVSGLYYWYDASYEDGMTTGGTESNVLVQEMVGRQFGGNLLPLVAPSGKEPVLLSDSVGNYINFTGGTELMTLSVTGGVDSLTAMTKFFVFTKSGGTSNEEMLVEIGTNYRSHYYYSNYGSSETLHAFDYPGPRFSGIYSWQKAPNFVNWAYMTKPTPYNYDSELNDGAYTSAPADAWGPVDMGRLSIGARSNGGNAATYQFREFLLYDNELTPTDITQVLNYLKDKWNYSLW